MTLIALLSISVAFIVVSTTVLQLHPILALLLAAFGYGLACGTLSPSEVVESINQGFGGTVGSIGIVILLGTLIGTFLEKTGGALSLAETILSKTGEKRVPQALGLVGYVVSIPVFCDSGFVILAPLAKVLAKRSKTSLASAAIALSLGLYATHTMVPPTPGPVAAAGTLDADLGRVIPIGLFVSLVSLAAGIFFALKVGPRVLSSWENDFTEEVAFPQKTGPSPTFFASIQPVLIPIVLILLRSVSELPSHPLGEGTLARALAFLGTPVVALFLGLLLALRLPRKISPEMLSNQGWVGEAVVSASTIVLVTGAGGAFGKVLQDSGIAHTAQDLLSGKDLGIWLPFLIAATLKSVQGSSTVALVTTAGIMLPLLGLFSLETETARALVVVAIGAGSMVVSHANDSFFWVVVQLTGLTVRDGYRLQTLGSLVQGGTAIVVVWAISRIFL